ncbi:MAG TPA: hypothetical protein VFC63_05460 [Blastocatellia bacterium]|nr:hypothetical protein [Blastocatellia bacterium]
MRKVGLSLLLILCFAGVSFCQVTASAQTFRPDSEMRADPKDIREIFLTVPWPTGVADSLAGMTAQKAGDINQRKRLLYSMARAEGENVLDVANGYLKLNLGEGDFVVTTYFQKANGDRLVVLQVGDSNVPDDLPLTEDYFFTLSHGSYNAESSSNLLPAIKFDDFWGSQPLPKLSVKNMIAPDPCYRIEWPRKGTIAKATYIEPYFDTEGKEELAAEKVANKRQFDEIDFVWDKQKGSFTKGQYKRHKPR